MISTRPLRSWHNLVLCLLPFLSTAQDIQWEKSYGGKHADYLFDAVPTADYGFILAGSSLSDKTGNKVSKNKGNLDYWVWKMDEKGEPVWQKSFGGEGIDLLQSIKLTNDGGFLLAGTSNSPKGLDKKEECRGNNDFWVIKLDAGGGEQWQKTIGGRSSDVLTSAIQTKDGGFILGGTSSSAADGDKTDKNRGNDDYWIIRLDNSGNIKWQKTYGGKYADALRNLSPTSDGGCIVVGYSNSNDTNDKTSKCYGLGDYWILKLNKQGEIEWQQTYGGDKDDQPYVVIQTQDGGYIVGGNSNSGSTHNKRTSSSKGSDFWIVKMDAEGASQWQESYDFGENDILTSLLENNDGTFLIGGHARSERVNGGKDQESINDYIALKITADGKEIWNRSLGSDGDDVLRKLIETRDGGYLLAGTSNPEKKPAKRKSGNTKAFTDNNKQLAGAQKAQDEIDNAVNEGREKVNEFYNEQTTAAADAINEAVGQDTDSALQMGVSKPGNLLSPSDSNNSSSGGQNNSGVSMGSPANNYKKQPASRNKSYNLGKNDFWVVKLKDKDKKEKVRQSVEAIPNPARDYTNVIVGYEFENGTATLYDINGRQLQSFSITEQTIPVNLEGMPEGIYILQVKTNKSTDSVKIMKSSNSN